MIRVVIVTRGGYTMTAQDKLNAISVKLEAMRGVIHLLDNEATGNPVAGAMTAVETIIDSIEEILNSKEDEL